jgi:hypothetical protein
LICQPAQSRKGYEPVRTDHDQASQPMFDARKSKVSAIRTNAVIQEKMTTLNADLNAMTEKRHGTVTWND